MIADKPYIGEVAEDRTPISIGVCVSWSLLVVGILIVWHSTDVAQYLVPKAGSGGLQISDTAAYNNLLVQTRIAGLMVFTAGIAERIAAAISTSAMNR